MASRPRLLRLIILSIFGAVVGSGYSALAQTSTARGVTAKQLVGTWTLVRYEVTRPNGAKLYPYGDPSKGVLTYDTSGRMSVQIMRPNRRHATDQQETSEDIRDAYNGYVAYFGRYSLDREGSVVTHHVEGSLDTWRIGVDQVRPLKLDGGRLVLSAEFTTDGERRTHTITWERAK
jgi:hypothetical protein